MGHMRGALALVVFGGMMLASHAKAVDIGVSTLKFISIDKETAAGKSKTVFVSKDPNATKTGDNDVANIAVELHAQYIGSGGVGVAKFDVPAGLSNGTDGWLVNKDAVAKYVNKAAPGGPTGAKVVVIKPGKLLKLIGKNRGDSSVLDLIGAADPVASLYTAYTVIESGGINRHCSEFQSGSCSFKLIGGGTGRKLVCKGGVADGGCTAAGPPPTTSTSTSSSTTTSTSSSSTTSTSTSSTTTTSTSTTSTSTSSTTSTSTSTTTTTILVAEFITGPTAGVCGASKTGGSGGAVIKALSCGGLNIGGGGSTVPEGPTPAGAPTRFNASCGGGICSLTARTAAQDGGPNSCTDTGCNFGTFLSIPNGGLSTCVHNTFAMPGSASLDTTTGAFSGSVPLSSAVNVTGNAANPCPSCVAGLCDGTATNAGASCTAVNGAGDTYDCLPGGVALAPFGVDLTPLSSGTETKSGPTFCPGQDASAPGLNGCFGSPACDWIEETGSPAVGISVGGGTVPATIVSVFCIPATGNGLIDGAADLPGPGATALPGTMEILTIP